MKNLLLIILSLLAYVVHGQNLVPNPGFEDYTNCPTGYSCVAYSNNYSNFPWVKSWANPMQNSTSDYFNVCANGTDAGVPNNLAGYQQPRTGNAYAGGYIYHDQDGKPYCEYLACKLTAPMQAGETYEIGFYVSNGMHALATSAMARVGVHFSDTFLYNVTDKYLSLKTHVAGPPNVLLTDTAGWTLVTGFYTAKGNEQYMTLGWFNDGVPINIVQQTPLAYSGAYYYFDDVSVTRRDVEITTQHITNCANPPYNTLLSATAGNTDYKWNTGATGQSTTATDTGTYWCISRNSLTIHIDSFFITDFNTRIIEDKNMVLCNADSVLIASIDGATNYSWNTGANTESIIARGIGVYTCSAIKNCSLYVHNYHIAKYVDTVTTVFDTTICIGKLPFMHKLTASINNADHYSWHNGDTARSINIADTGIYWCHATKNCILYTDTFIYRQKRYTELAILGPDTTICYYNVVSYKIGQPKAAGTYYSWNTGDTGCCIYPPATGTYILSISDGCTTVSDTVNLVINDCDSCIYAPDVFTPNRDGLNDDFRVFSRCVLTDFQLLIVSRYGQVVFESNDIARRWNGAFKGAILDLNTFYYMARYKTAGSNTWLMKKGSVTLVH